MTNVFHMWKKLAAGLAFVGCLTWVGVASAAQATSDLEVSATVQSTCTIDAASVSFLGYDPVGTHNAATGIDLDATGTVTINCTMDAAVTVALDLGQWEGAGTQRKLQNPAGDQLNYNLYSDSARSVEWNDTTGTVSETGTGADDVLTVYGRIPKGQTNAEATTTYSDVVVATVTF